MAKRLKIKKVVRSKRKRTQRTYKRKVLGRLRKVAANARAVLQRRRNAAKRIAVRKHLLTALQIAKRFRVTPQSVYLWRKRGLLGTKVKSLILFDPRQVEYYLLYARRK